MKYLAFLFVFFAAPALAEVVVAVRTIPAQSIITPDDLALKDTTVVGGLSETAPLVGMEARVALFAGRPISLDDVRVPAVVQRNEIIQLIYLTAGLTIKTDGRALDRASPGDHIRVMNLASRTTVTATIDEFGAAHVSQ